MHSAIRCATLLLALLLPLVPIQPLRAAADNTIELYRSEEFGHFFFYDSAIWSVVNQTTEVGSDYVSLTDGDVVALAWAFDSPGISPRECMEWVINDFYPNDEAIVAVEPIKSGFVVPRNVNTETESSLPEISDFPPRFASVELLVIRNAGGQRSNLATQERCRELIPGKSLLYTSIAIPAASWNAGRQFYQPGVQAGTASSVVPWIKGYAPGDEQHEYTYYPNREAHIPVVTATGDAIGTLSVDPWGACDVPEFVVARNASVDTDFVIDPSAFVVYHDDVSSPDAGLPDEVEWLYPEMRRGRPLVLKPGEVGLFRLALSQRPNGLFFIPEGQPRVILRQGTPGGCAGGAAPMIVDAE